MFVHECHDCKLILAISLLVQLKKSFIFTMFRKHKNLHDSSVTWNHFLWKSTPCNTKCLSKRGRSSGSLSFI